MMFNPPEEVKSWFNKLICYFLHFNAEKNGYFKNHEQKVKSGSILNRICLQEKGKLMEMNRNPRATKYYQDGADRLRFNMPAFNWLFAVKWNCHLHHYKACTLPRLKMAPVFCLRLVACIMQLWWLCTVMIIRKVLHQYLLHPNILKSETLHVGHLDKHLIWASICINIIRSRYVNQPTAWLFVSNTVREPEMQVLLQISI